MPSESPQTKTQGDVLAVKRRTPGWVRFLIPSVTDLLFATLLLGLSCGALGRLLLRDASIGWHIRDGQQILLSHAITRTDAFSSTMHGHTWYAWEWLYDVLIALVHHVLGLNGVVFYSAAMIAATFVVTLHVALRDRGNLPVTLLLLILSLGASAVHFFARPHLVSWLFTMIWFAALDSAERRKQESKNVLWLPILMLVWVNLHGGFLVGFALLVIYLFAAVGRYYKEFEARDETLQWLWRLLWCLGLSVGASFINPYGYNLHLHVWGYLTDRFLMNHITEFFSPDFHGAAQQCFAVLLIVTILALASASRRPRASQLMVILFAAYGGLYATRSLPTSSLLIAMVIAPLLSENISEAAANASIAPWLRDFFSRLDSFGARMGRLEVQFRGHLWMVLVFAIGLFACVNHGRLGSEQFINAYFDDKRFPVQAAEVIAQREVHEPIFSLDYWGGYLIYRLHPQTKVVVDDRHDLYGDQFFQDYLKIVLVQPGWDKALNEKQVKWVLVPAESSLANIMRLTSEWTVSYEDGTAALFHRQ
ncbi:MAG TPA: hypothetical protein VMB49_03805 [Acidobacteriaceae bacterium]|nr:hypothetical protein [Acidobacteriaceae bacterium]